MEESTDKWEVDTIKLCAALQKLNLQLQFSKRFVSLQIFRSAEFKMCDGLQIPQKENFWFCQNVATYRNEVGILIGDRQLDKTDRCDTKFDNK